MCELKLTVEYKDEWREKGGEDRMGVLSVCWARASRGLTVKLARA